VSFAQNISGRGHFEQVGAGDITLAGYNTYSGDTLIDDGSLTVASTGRIGGVTGSNYAGNITVSAGASLINESSATQQWSGTLSSAGTFAQDGTGILALYGSNTFASDIAVTDGALGAFNDDAFGTVQVDVTNAGLLLGAGVTLANNITLTGTSTIETGRIVEYLIVGGGGGGGARHGGGGGAGGFIEGA
jgi:autotransporter-associated beta strand protein